MIAPEGGSPRCGCPHGRYALHDEGCSFLRDAEENHEAIVMHERYLENLTAGVNDGSGSSFPDGADDAPNKSKGDAARPASHSAPAVNPGLTDAEVDRLGIALASLGIEATPRGAAGIVAVWNVVEEIVKPRRDATVIEFGSVSPGATEPDAFYDSIEDAVADCAMGPCRIVQRTVTPWRSAFADGARR